MIARTELLTLVVAGIFARGGAMFLGTTDPQDGKAREPLVQLLTANVDRSYRDGKPRNTFTITGTSPLHTKKVFFDEEDASDSTVNAVVGIDECSPEVAQTLIVKVKDRLFLPGSYLGNGGTISSLVLRDVDRASAAILNGGPLPSAPEESINVEMQPLGPAALAGQVLVYITVVNVGDVPLTIYWGRTGGGNYPCRDTQLSFQATLDGVPVPANPKPLPDGFIVSPFDAKPNWPLKRTVDLTEWLQFQKPGKYLVEATYEIAIENPQKDASLREWTVRYHKRFPVEITPSKTERPGERDR